MFRAAIATVTLGLLVAGCNDDFVFEGDDTEGSGTINSRVTDVLALTGDATSGATIFSASCSGCHNEDGTANIGPALVDSVPALTAETSMNILIEGQGGMPSYSSFTDQELADTFAHLETTWGPSATE